MATSGNREASSGTKKPLERAEMVGDGPGRPDRRASVAATVTQAAIRTGSVVEQRRVAGVRGRGRRRHEPEVLPGGRGGDPPAGGPSEETVAHQERLGHLLDGLPLLADGDRERGDPDRPAAEPATEDVDDRAVTPVQA